MRIRRNCTNLSDYKLNIVKLINVYRERGYNELELKLAATNTEFSNRETLLTPKTHHTNDNTAPVCVLPFNKHNPSARNIILKYWHFLKKLNQNWTFIPKTADFRLPHTAQLF